MLIAQKLKQRCEELPEVIRAQVRDSHIFLVEPSEELRAAAHEVAQKPEVFKELFRLPYPNTLIELHGSKLAILFSQTESGYTYSGFLDLPNKVGMDLDRKLYPHTLALDENGELEASWEDECTFQPELIFEVMAQVALINSRKIIDVVEKPAPAFINKQRLKKNKPPLCSYSIIKIKPYIAQEYQNQGGTKNKSLHWVRGHFKARKTGVFWWSAHQAGNREQGEIKSGYLV